MKEVRCPVCNTSFVVGLSGNAVSELNDGIHYLVPETVRNDNVKGKVNDRLEALKSAGIDVSKLQSLMQKDDSIKDLFSTDDPIIAELSKGGFIRNPELFRRWITAQTFRLLADPQGWTHAVRKSYDITYVFRQTLEELVLQIKLKRKGVMNDKRFTFFTLDAMKNIFIDLCYRAYLSLNGYGTNDYGSYEERIRNADCLEALYNVVQSRKWKFPKHLKPRLPYSWLNCFKGAGAYYTLQNIIRTHGLVLPDCTDMNDSLERVEKLYKDIISYRECERRWDILMSLLVSAVHKTNFELKY